ncbi:phosphoribosylglycinamide formyltransferase [Robiginitalea sp. SC105]|uniref:phosphoribosylglycinamide formyltransferase n=1 Tax=Robiginitalea sp. SC105 TaxID=2762332 RepID=UPI00163AA060|nr:phosphoribosylglycinamide formyltransferase [Robiginitalea sp. SC105]MBC2838065.1 phosphoribosylglycinamide formyltransferase [Robiginitalea sp. SC105]
MPKNILLFASGSGSNVENIANYFQDDSRVVIRAVFGNNLSAGVVERCKRLGIPFYGFNRAALSDTTGMAGVLRSFEPDLVVLAGFLWKVPAEIVRAFEGRMINIHPALLPSHGGKGMYGMRVHEAVVRDGDARTGITIHYVNEAYDDGAVILQESVVVAKGDTPETVAGKVHALEYEFFPRAIESLLFPANG